MANLINSLKTFGKKITGKDIESQSLIEVLDETTEKYEKGDGPAYTAGNGITITADNLLNADVKVLVVEDIEALTNEQCNSLNAGDIVVVDSMAYKVLEKGTQDLQLQITLSDAIEAPYYFRQSENSEWEYQSTTETPLDSGSGGIEFVQIDSDATSINQETLEKLVDFKDNSLKPNFIVLTIDGSYDTPILMPSDNLAYVYRSAVMNGSYYQLTLYINEEGADIDIEQISATPRKYLHSVELQLHRDLTAQGVVYNDSFIVADFLVVSSRSQRYETFAELVNDIVPDGSNFIMQPDYSWSNGKHWKVTHIQPNGARLNLSIAEQTYVSVIDSTTQETHTILSEQDSSFPLTITGLTESDRLLDNTPIAL